MASDIERYSPTTLKKTKLIGNPSLSNIQLPSPSEISTIKTKKCGHHLLNSLAEDLFVFHEVGHE